MAGRTAAPSYAARWAGGLGAAAGAMLAAPVRMHDSFDFGWKFFRGDAPGAQALAGTRPPSSDGRHGSERATEIPRASFGHLPETAQ